VHFDTDEVTAVTTDNLPDKQCQPHTQSETPTPSSTKSTKRNPPHQDPPTDTCAPPVPDTFDVNQFNKLLSSLEELKQLQKPTLSKQDIVTMIKANQPKVTFKSNNFLFSFPSLLTFSVRLWG
jgi:hypothetical protein